MIVLFQSCVGHLHHSLQDRDQASPLPNDIQTQDLLRDMVMSFQSALSNSHSTICYTASTLSGVKSIWSSFKATITAACNKLPRAPKGQDTDWVTDEVRNLSKKKEAWVHLCNNTSIALQWDLTSAAERRRHWQFCTPHPVHSPSHPS